MISISDRMGKVGLAAWIFARNSPFPRSSRKNFGIFSFPGSSWRSFATLLHILLIINSLSSMCAASLAAEETAYFGVGIKGINFLSNFRLTKMQRMQYASSHTDETVYKERQKVDTFNPRSRKNRTKEELESGGNWDGP